MLLLKEIQNATTDSNMSIADLLRKCRILAFHLRHEEFKTWVDHELNGYPSKDNLPDYRILDVESVGNFIGAFWSQYNNAPIPTTVIPKEHRHSIEKYHMTDPISSIETLVNKKGKGTGSFRASWSANLIATYGQKIYEGMSCTGAWLVMSEGQFVGIIDTVRNRILQFVLEIGGQISDTEDISVDSFSLPQEEVSQVFNTYIMGDASRFVVGSQTNVQVQRGDLSSLKAQLEKIGIEKQEIEQLEDALKEDSKEGGNKIGKKTGEWLGKVISKASSGAFKVGTNVVTKVLTEGISEYLGLS